jgi:hypothetical protein
MMETQNVTKNVVQSIFSGIKVAVLYLLIGLVLDYFLTQAISQYFIVDCSEDCYFRYFNSIFAAVVVVSVAGGILSGFRTYNRLENK